MKSLHNDANFKTYFRFKKQLKNSFYSEDNSNHIRQDNGKKII